MERSDMAHSLSVPSGSPLIDQNQKDLIRDRLTVHVTGLAVACVRAGESEILLFAALPR